MRERKEKPEKIKEHKNGKGIKIVVGVIILFLALGLVMKMVINKEIEKEPTNVVVEQPIEEEPLEEPIEVPIEEPIEEPIEVPIETPIEEPNDIGNQKDYENKIIGIGFNYDTNMYLYENTDIIFNTLKASSQGKDYFDIRTDKVIEDIEVLNLTYQGNSKIKVTMLIQGVEEGKEYTIENINTQIQDSYKIKEIKKETEEEIVVNKKDKKKESEKKEEVVDTRIEIESFTEVTPTYTYEVNGEVKATVSEYMILQNTKSYKIREAYIPIGLNMVILRITSEGETEGIDFYGIIDEIIETIEIIREEG